MNSSCESNLRSQVSQLLDQQALLTEIEELKVLFGNFKHVVANYESKANLNASTLMTDTTLLERSLQEAKIKISDLLKVKERFADFDQSHCIILSIPTLVNPCFNKYAC